MKLFLLIVSMLSPTLVLSKSIVIGDTKDYHSVERYTWEIEEEEIEKLPIWKKGDDIPLEAKNAERIAYSWSRRQMLAGYLPERPFTLSIQSFPEPYSDKYYYKVHFASSEGHNTLWTVHITFDGTVIEPKKIEPNNKGSCRLSSRKST